MYINEEKLLKAVHKVIKEKLSKANDQAVSIVAFIAGAEAVASELLDENEEE